MYCEKLYIQTWIKPSRFSLVYKLIMQVPWSITCHVIVFLQLSGVAPPPLCRNVMPNCQNLTTLSVDSSPKSIVNSPIQAPRRKFVGEGKLRKVGSIFQPIVASLVGKHANGPKFSL